MLLGPSVSNWKQPKWKLKMETEIAKLTAIFDKNHLCNKTALQ